MPQLQSEGPPIGENLRGLARAGVWAQLPSDDLTCPRDAQPLVHSSDLLFQVRLLARRKMGCSRIAAFREGKRMIYLLQGPKGALLHPMTGVPVEPAPDWDREQNPIKMGSVEKCVAQFWHIRSMGRRLGSGQDGSSLFVDGLPLFTDGRRDSEAVASAAKRWPGWALDGGEDAVLDHVRDLTLLDVASWDPAPPPRCCLALPSRRPRARHLRALPHLIPVMGGAVWQALGVGSLPEVPWQLRNGPDRDELMWCRQGTRTGATPINTLVDPGRS